MSFIERDHTDALRENEEWDAEEEAYQLRVSEENEAIANGTISGFPLSPHRVRAYCVTLPELFRRYECSRR